MTGKVLNIDNVISKDDLGCRIAQFWVEWNINRQAWKTDVEEVRKYVFATDTTTTTNSKLPWKNKTTVPKLCQIRDNLLANYTTHIFPRRKFIQWEASHTDSNAQDKRHSILSYMSWAVEQDRFRQEVTKCLLDYIDYGNVFGTVEWVDERSSLKDTAVKVGYVGPTIRRISPLDIVFNPLAPTFMEAPKIVRSLVSMGEVKKLLEAQSTDENREAYETLFKYLQDVRITIRNNPGDNLEVQDAFLQVDGFTSYRAYLESEYVEILTFYGDIWNREKGEYLQNHKIMVVDRHKIISSAVNPSYFGYTPIWHVGWRIRQDNLWAMGPLANLVGLQYRLDHIENLKADVFDLLVMPVLKITGFVQEFEWRPFEKIFVGDEGNVEILSPPFQILQANVEIQYLTSMMEEMAGSPKEAMGFRTPGEKTAFEVSRLENASARIFTHKSLQFEEQFVERVMNGMLELSRRNLSDVLQIPVWDDEFNAQVFMSLTPNDITGVGRLKPIAARNIAERADMIQTLNNFYSSGPGQDPEVRQHISSIQIAKMAEELLNWKDYQLIQPNIRVSERADAQRLMNMAEEQVTMEAQTPTGMTADDWDESAAPVPQPMMGMGDVPQ